MAETETGSQDAAVGVGLDDEGLVPWPFPHRAEGERERGRPGAATQRSDGDDVHGVAATSASDRDLAAAADATAGAADSGTRSDTIQVPVLSSSDRTS